jgi:hypothetical protein
MRHAAPRFITLQHLRHCRVDAEELAVRRGAEYANWSVFEKVTVPFFPIAEGHHSLPERHPLLPLPNSHAPGAGSQVCQDPAHCHQ